MIPKEVADVREILTKHFHLSPQMAETIAWHLYQATLLKQQ